MKVTVLENKKVSLNALPVGSAFEICGTLHIKTSDHRDERQGHNTIWYLKCENLWFSSWCHPEAKVTPVEMEIRVSSLP